MPRRFDYREIDVFTEQPLRGNPLAVVLGAEGLTDAQMQAFAHWANFSETTFLLPPTDPAADYRVRIFTPVRELPFAGHPTLGSCHAWLAAGHTPKGPEVVQQCAVGLVRIRRDGSRLAFAAPPLSRSGPVDEATLARIARATGLPVSSFRASNWTDNGAGWVSVLLGSREELLSVRVDGATLQGLQLGLVAPWPGGEADFEVRALIGDASGYEDPVTGGLNAGLAQWLIGAGLAPARYVARQGTCLGRAGNVFVEKRGGDIWVGGSSVTVVEGSVAL
jgi:PhzF family phenazine biosynthesis protein